MKKFFSGMVLSVILLGAPIGFADTGIPNLVGTWNLLSEGGVLLRGPAVGPKTHHNGEFSSIKAEMIILKQQGRVVHGMFKSQRATEKIVGVIAEDNVSIYIADEDGFLEGKINEKGEIKSVYRHSTANDTVVALATWTRKK